jgi:hypothetical protein
MTFPLMPFIAAATISRSQAAAFINTNYATLMSPTQRTGFTSTSFSARTSREQYVNAENPVNQGFWNTTIPAPSGFVSGTTVLFFGGRYGSGNADISGATVNGASVSITQVYNTGGSSAGAWYESLYYCFVPIQPQSITVAGALFPYEIGSNNVNAGCLYILPGRWTPSSVVTGASDGAAVTVSIQDNEVVAYSCSNEVDAGGANVTFTAGTNVASAKSNWYGGAQHGLMYRTTAGNVTLTPTSLASFARMHAVKFTYS